jgi:TatD DNase family protein
MNFIDTHAHSYSEQFAPDRDEMVQRAFNAGVKKIYMPNVDSESIAGMLALEAKYPENCVAMMGLHPCSVKENYLAELKIVEKWLAQRSFCAIGEIGIDLYWDKTFFNTQKHAFLQQVAWARALKTPFVIHTRDSTDIVIDLLQKEPQGKMSGIFHCFGGTLEQAKAIIDLGFLMGIGGVATFKKSGLEAVLPHIPLENLVLETDAPYLAPVPYRGKRNESAYIPLIAEKIAQIKGISLEKVAAITSQNAEKLFETRSFSQK